MGAGRVMARKLWPTHLLQDQEQGWGGEGPELLSDLGAARCMAEQRASVLFMDRGEAVLFYLHPP